MQPDCWIRLKRCFKENTINSHFTFFDWIVLAVYCTGTIGIGMLFYRRTRTTEGFTAGNRSLPGWICGLSIFATYLSSISYLALPGKSFADNWNPFVYSLSIPLVTWIAVKYFLPYYRSGGEVSAYAMLEKRFGAWARIYASFFYLLTQIARIAVVMYLMALPLQVLFGWDIYTILIITGVSVTFYSFVGGIVGVIWVDAIQALVLIVGAVLCLVLMLFQLPGGIPVVLEVASEQGKFSLGSFGPTLALPTFWVVLLYGIVINLQNFGIDQSYVQRYIAAGSDRAARRSLWLGGLLYVPMSAIFFFIGTTLFVYYNSDHNLAQQQEVRMIVARQQLLQEGISADDPEFSERQEQVAGELGDQAIGDRVFPHFIATHLPPGLTGLLIAAVFAAAMSTVSTSLNSSATLLMTDYYRRFIHPGATERQSMIALYTGTITWGALGTGLALLLVRLTESALDIYWTLAGIFGGGMTGLFLLGFISRRARRPAAMTAVAAGIVLILWMSLPELQRFFGSSSPEEAWWISPFHSFLVPVFGMLVILLVGVAVSRILDREKS